MEIFQTKAVNCVGRKLRVIIDDSKKTPLIAICNALILKGEPFLDSTNAPKERLFDFIRRKIAQSRKSPELVKVALDEVPNLTSVSWLECVGKTTMLDLLEIRLYVESDMESLGKMEDDGQVSVILRNNEYDTMVQVGEDLYILVTDHPQSVLKKLEKVDGKAACIRFLFDGESIESEFITGPEASDLGSSWEQPPCTLNKQMTFDEGGDIYVNMEGEVELDETELKFSLGIDDKYFQKAVNTNSSAKSVGPVDPNLELKVGIHGFYGARMVFTTTYANRLERIEVEPDTKMRGIRERLRDKFGFKRAYNIWYKDEEVWKKLTSPADLEGCKRRWRANKNAAIELQIVTSDQP